MCYLCSLWDGADGADDHHVANERTGAVGRTGMVDVGSFFPKAG